MGSQKQLNFTIIHTDSTFQWFYALNFRQTPAIREISRTQLHTGTPHVICHTTTAIACVFVIIWVQSQNRGYRMCTSQEIGTGKAVTLKFIHTSWRIESHTHLVSTLLQSHGQVTRNKHPTIPQNTTTFRRDTV